jgi:hypothetical protein
LTDRHEPGKVKVPRYNWESSAFFRHQFRLDRCNSDKVHFKQIIKSKVRMNRMNQNFDLFQQMPMFMASFISAGGQPDGFLDPPVDVQGEDIKPVIIPGDIVLQLLVDDFDVDLGDDHALFVGVHGPGDTASVGTSFR